MRFALAATAALVLAAVSSCSYSPPGRCEADPDCPLGLVCAEGVCSGCSKNSECHVWQECSAGNTCVAMEGMCGVDADCLPEERCDADHTCVLCTDPECTDVPTTTDPTIGSSGGGEVFLYGTLLEGASYRDVLCNLYSPNTVYAAFGDDNIWNMSHRRADGRFIYLRRPYNAKGELRLVGPESIRFASDGTYDFPTNPEANDTLVSTPACDARGGVGSYQVHPSGGVWYTCREGTFEYFEGTTKKNIGNCSSIRAIGTDGSLLCRSPYTIVVDSSGTTHTLTPPLPGSEWEFRSKPGGGFWVVVSIDSRFERWTIAPDGTTSKDGEYAPVPEGLRAGGGTLDSQGRWYRVGNRTADPMPDLFIRSDFSSSTVVYDEKKKPRCKYHISYLVHSN